MAAMAAIFLFNWSVRSLTAFFWGSVRAGFAAKVASPLSAGWYIDPCIFIITCFATAWISGLAEANAGRKVDALITSGGGIPAAGASDFLQPPSSTIPAKTTAAKLMVFLIKRFCGRSDVTKRQD